MKLKILAIITFGILFNLFYINFTPISGTSTCQVNPSAAVTTDRVISLTMSGCTDVQRFQISESPDFSSPANVTINLSNLATDHSTADLSINYDGGVIGGNGTPYAIPSPIRTINALAVLFTYEDENGQIAGTATYETPLWLHRLIFGDDVIGYDGYFKNNSFRDHLYQSTNGHVVLTGQTYPKVIRLPLGKFRGFLSGPTPSFKDALYAAIKLDDPNFFNTNQFEFLFGVSSDTYMVRRGIYQLSSGVVIFGSALDREKSILDSPISEVRTSFDASTVVPRYNPATVTGVWLESDVNRTGTNYFLGGSLVSYKNQNIEYYLKLGTPLPQANAKVQIQYAARTMDIIDRSLPNQYAPDGAWVSTLFHETYHMISSLPNFKFTDKLQIGDAYRTPNRFYGYDLMANGGIAIKHPIEQTTSYNPALLSMFNKISLGLVTPYTLKYGESESVIRLNRAEFADINYLKQGISAIKIPLRRTGDPGFASKNISNFYNESSLTTSSQTNKQYSGEEFVVLELRSRSPLLNDKFNFDTGIYSQGVVAYHVIQADPYGPTTHSGDIIEMIDVTPPAAGEISNIPGSYANLGHESQVYQMKVPEFWQDKVVSQDSHQFKYLLSQGRGVKNLYVRFANASGAILGTGTLQVQLDDDKVASDRLPTLAVAIKNGATSTSRYLQALTVAPNGTGFLRAYINGKLVFSKTKPTTPEVFYFDTKQISTGTHTFKVDFYDAAFNLVSQTISFSEGTSTALSAATSLATQLSSTSSVIVTWAPSMGALTLLKEYEVYRDGILIGTTEASPYVDTSIFPGRTYQYYVVARSITNQSTAPTNIASVTIPGTSDNPPQAVISASSVSGTAPLLVSFSAAGAYDLDGSIISYAWSFGDGTTGGGPFISKTYSSPGIYTAELTVTDDTGLTSSKSVNINVAGAVPVPVCTKANPAITPSSQTKSGLAGSVINYSISVKNQDSSACMASSFNISRSLPTGWVGSVSPSSISLSPGGSASVTMTVTSPASATGNNNIIVNATSGAYSGSATAIYSVTAPPPPPPPPPVTSLTVTASTDKSVYLSGQTVLASAKILSGGTAVANASVNFQVIDPRGKSTTYSAVSDSGGVAKISYSLGTKSPKGVYQIKVTANSQSLSGSSSVNFTKQ